LQNRKPELFTTCRIFDYNDALEKIDMENIKIESRIKIKEEMNHRNSRSNDNSDKIAAYELNSCK
jgi:hypothetical protein